ncbi:MAG: diguanylate cyclase, partial [Thermoanaerobaculia bacterium]|nr:diguanylate cyclase [Thermoanaerobaculia bacterium]
MADLENDRPDHPTSREDAGTDPEEERSALLRRLDALRKELVEIEEKLDLRSGSSPRKNVPAVAESALASLISGYSTDLLSVHTIEGNYVFASPNSEEFLGIAPQDLVGKSAYEFFHPDDLVGVADDPAAHLSALGDRKIRYRLLPRNQESRPRWVETRSRVTSDGEYIVCITRDVHGDVKDELEQKARAEHFRREAYTDFLTRLPNRRALEEAVDREYSRAVRRGYSFSVAIFDIDNFKQINDELGHGAGDRVLQRVSRLLSGRRRKYATLGRWAGDEFLLLLPETTLGQAAVAAAHYRNRVAEARIPCGDDFVTLSGGVSSSSSGGGVDQILSAADAALYESKSLGRNRISSREA